MCHVLLQSEDDDCTNVETPMCQNAQKSLDLDRREDIWEPRRRRTCMHTHEYKHTINLGNKSPFLLLQEGGDCRIVKRNWNKDEAFLSRVVKVWMASLFGRKMWTTFVCKDLRNAGDRGGGGGCMFICLVSWEWVGGCDCIHAFLM